MTTELVLLRRRHALKQSELAKLIDIVQTTVGRLENGRDETVHNLRLETAFALQVVFGKRPDQIFNQLFQEVEDAVMSRAAEFDRDLDGLNDRATEHKRALLLDMVRRSASNPISP